MAGGAFSSLRARRLTAVLTGAGAAVIITTMMNMQSRLASRQGSFSTDYLVVSSSTLSGPYPAVVPPVVNVSETRRESPLAESAPPEPAPRITASPTEALVTAAPTRRPTRGPESNCTIVRRDTSYFDKWSPPRCLAEFDIPQ
jgi:hypothetical protein